MGVGAGVVTAVLRARSLAMGDENSKPHAACKSVRTLRDSAEPDMHVAHFLRGVRREERHSHVWAAAARQT